MGKNEYTDRFLDIVFRILKPSSKKDFAERIGLNKSKFRNIEIGKNGVPIDALCSFIEEFPQFNSNYILTGKGSMFIENIESDVISDSEAINKGNQDIIIELQNELKEAYEEIGRLNMELNKKIRRV
jgi:transcriptional regulator with XRE-family HTH domain